MALQMSVLETNVGNREETGFEETLCWAFIISSAIVDHFIFLC